jgi:NCS1 family nucleobase:cation symporter-1
MKWFNAISSIVIAIVMAYMFVHIMSSSPIELADSWTAEGDWGPAFWIAMTGAIGALATVMLNISDMTRHLQVSQKNLWVGHLLGVLPPWFFMLSLGIVAGATIGVWNPVDALMQLSPHPAAMIVLLTFILLAQFTTNLTINVLPPALVFMDMFKISWERAVLATGVLGVLSFPWLLLSNSEAFFGFILYYSAFFGPILGVMLADYYVIRRRTLDVPAHYETGEGATFWYGGGFNIAGLIAVFLPGTIAMIWFLPMAWTIGLPSGFVIYLALFGRLHGVTRSGDFNTNPSGT